MNTIKSTATVTMIDLTPEEAEMLGILSDIIHDHLNLYELTKRELRQLENGMEIVDRLWSMAGGH